MQNKRKDQNSDIAAAGLPEAPSTVDDELRKAGIDPDRLSILHLGIPAGLLKYPYPRWLRRMIFGLVLWIASRLLEIIGISIPDWTSIGLALIIGLILLQAACDALITATERFAARMRWAHYVTGTLTEILSTIPEVVTIGFIIPVSPLAAFVIALITIYNNALVFSLYSFFLPKDKEGKFLMPKPITEAGTQILIAGAAIGLTLGLVLLALSSNEIQKTSFDPVDLTVVGVTLLIIFSVYVYKLVHNYSEEEEEVAETLGLTEQQIEQRRALVYQNVKRSSMSVIVAIFAAGVIGAFIGGERVAHFADASIKGLDLNPILTALVLALFAGMSEYVILWKSHRKREYGIALANAFGGITQVMYLVLPVTLLSIAFYQSFVNPSHEELPIQFTLSNVLLLIFLAPTFFVLAELLEEDHTLSILDTTIMTAILFLLILLLVTYGANGDAFILRSDH